MIIASGISIVAGTVAYLRGKSFERKGCPRCDGPLERGGSGLRCRPCSLYWTLEGDPVGHVPEDEQWPRAQARRKWGRSTPPSPPS
jgi:hypothetical protein